MAILAAAIALAGHAYYTTAITGIIVSLAAVWLYAARAALSPRLALVGLSACLMSKAFVDYATSGLENPLLHLLIVFFCLAWWQGEGRASTGWLSLLFSLALLTRMDAALLLGPPMLTVLFQRRSARAIWLGALGSVPFLVWEVFSVFYYGFPFPNTAYAKLSTGADPAALWIQGMHYFVRAVVWDPVTPAIMLAAVVVTAARGMRQYAPLAAGIVLYAVYTCKIGGDFMAGRFLTAPFFCGLLILGRLTTLDTPRRCLAALLAVGGLWVVPSFTPDPGYVDDYGISDERRYYQPGTRLVTQARYPLLQRRDVRETIASRDTPPSVWVLGTVGMVGFFAGPRVHIIDHFALGDPLLARLPALGNWRPGHFQRRIPDGYPATIASQRTLLTDRPLAAYYDALTTIVRGPLWSRERLKTILDFNLGRYDDVLDDYGLLTLTISEGCLSNPATPAGRVARWPVPERGVRITVTPGRASGARILVSNRSDYVVSLFHMDRQIKKTVIRMQAAEIASERPTVLSAEAWPPPGTRYDRIVVKVARGHAYGELLEVCLGR
jgi:arabinofuranosyltransferase